MPGVLTTGSNVTCGHSPGKVTTTGSPKLTVSGQPALLKTGIMGKPVGGCSTPPASDASGPTAIPCTSVIAVTAGDATKLTIGGMPVMLDTLAGQTNGMVGKVTPQQLLSATAVQTKLTTS
jgi:hypothetical protein